MNRLVSTQSTQKDLLWFALVAAIAILVHGWIALNDKTTFTFSDSVDYMFMADFYRGMIYGGDVDSTRAFYRITRFPPLFPALLGALGGGSEQQHLAAVISNLIAVGGVFAVWLWVKRDFESAATASAVAIAIALYPAHFLLNLSPVSEPLAILLICCVFALLLRPRLTVGRLLLISFVVGIAPLARGALLPLPIAFVLWLVISGRFSWRQMVSPAIISFTPFLLWTIYRYLLGSEQYSAHLNAEQFSSSSVVWPDAIWTQPIALFKSFESSWISSNDSIAVVLCTAAICMTAIAGCCIRVYRNCIDAWFLVGYIILILVWPFPGELSRFLVVAYPVMLVSSITFLDAVQSRLFRFTRPYLRLVIFAAIGFASAPVIALFLHRATLPIDTELLGDKLEPPFFLAASDADALLNAEHFGRARYLLKQASERIPAEGCLYATPPQVATLYSGRVALTYPLDLGKDSEAASRRLLLCDFYFIATWSAPEYGLERYYPIDVLKGWAKPVLVSRIGDGADGSVSAALFQRVDRPLETTNDKPDN